MALLILCTLLLDVFNQRHAATSYALSPAAEQLLPTANAQYATKVSYDTKTGKYEYNKNYQPQTGGTSLGGPKFTASIAADLQAEGVSVTDPVNGTSITLVPEFGALRGEQYTNRIIYPLVGRNAQKVYTLGATGVKEDIILNEYQGDTAKFDYKLKLPSGTEARLETNGTIAVYGVDSTLLGNVTTGTEADAKLLDNARKNGAKNTLLFTLPAPYVKESGTKGASKKVKTYYGYKNGIVTVYVRGMKGANYPLTIDPTIYIDTAQKLMLGNNESNIEFDATNELIQKSQTTGARIDEWSSTNNLNNAVWQQGTAVAGGYIYSAGGALGGTLTSETYYSSGNSSFTVPTGITSITVKVWGAGGGGGAGSNSSGRGGHGGGGGFTQATLAVTPGESLTMSVGSGGTGATTNRYGGDGGGFSAVRRSATYLAIAGGGAGGGAGNGTQNGGAGGAGGGGNGQDGTAGTASYGRGATTSTAGAGGAGSTGGTAGSVGAAYGGGNAGGSGATCSTAVTNTQAGAGGTGGGGDGGDSGSCSNGGAGGGGRYGGGGGGSANTSSSRRGGGGGGGSGMVTGSGTVQSMGNYQTPANSSDSQRNSAGDGGTGGTNAAGTTNGNDGGIVVTYTAVPSTNITDSVQWARFNTATNAIDSPNPGAGACTGWCSNAVYSLPVALRGLSLVAYNGYLYAIGGSNSSGTPQTSVYIAKLGANGEPQLWHPTGGTAVYWYQDTALSNARSYFAALAYNNRMYLFGGLTTSTTLLSTNTVQYANIQPNGLLSGLTSTGMSALSTARYGLSAQVYNDTVYVLGGNTTFNGTPVNTVEYAKLNADGTMNSWKTTNTFTTGRQTMGGSFSALWGAYIYIGGGCTTVDTNGRCTAIASDVQLASVNADGSLAPWGTIVGIANAQIGYTFIAWQNGLYKLGGCVAQSTTTGECTDTIYTVQYGVINQDGDASTVSNSDAAGTGTCSGATPYNCDLPSSGNDSGGHAYAVGEMSSMVVINNGYIYNIGGCITDACDTMSNDTAYAVLNSDGTMGKPSTCSTTYGGYVTNSIWCVVDTTNVLNGTSGLGAAGATVFNNTIYIIGGTSGGTTWSANVFRTSIGADGSIGAWSSQTFSGVGMGSGGSNTSTTTARGYMYAFTRAYPAGGSTTPGNLYMLGGCYGGGEIGCTTTTYFTEVIKCNIAAAGTLNTCSTAGQLQIDSDNVNSGSQGLGLMAGTIYANRIYLVGGACTATGSADDPCGSNYSGNRKDTIYAKIDNSNNIVDNDTGSSSGSWKFTTAQMSPVRRRAISFGYNGYIYSLAGYSGSASLQDLLFAKINVTSGDLESPTWSSSGVVVTPRWDLRAIVNNGYVYAIGGCGDGAAPSCNTGGLQPQIQTFQLYNNDSGAAASYALGTSNPGSGAQRIGGSSVILNGYLYYAGGCTDIGCTTLSGTVNYIALDAYGNQTGSWMTSALPSSAVRAWGKLVTAGGGLYYVGGQSGTALTTAQTTVYYASVSGGTPTWGTATNGLPAARTQAGVAVWNNRIYVAGGYNASSAVQSTVYVSPVLTGGNITSTWATNSTSFSVARAGLTAVAYANNLYIFGGYDGTNWLLDSQFASLGYKQGTICQGNVAGNCSTSGTVVTGTGTNWVSSMVGSTLVYPDGATATITAVNSTTSLTVSVARVLSAGTTYTIQDGSIGGSWTYSTSLPGPLRDADGFAANGYIYLVGGRSAATTCLPNTLVTPVSANTSINSLDTNGMADDNNPTGVGEWYETNQRYSGDRYGSGVAYANGRVYVMGGGCSALVTTSGPDQWLYQSTLYSQPQIAKYSRMIDTDSDVYATTWLANGVDNSTGAQWSLSYRSMNNPLQTDTSKACGGSVMTGWGTQVNMGSITLGRPGAYVIKNNSGTTISCARYFYLSLTVDVSQSFGYPEDVTRGPTIADLSLFYTSDASKRMIHGKTFSGGLQQPLDAQCRQSNNQLSVGVNNPLYSDCPNP